MSSVSGQESFLYGSWFSSTFEYTLVMSIILTIHSSFLLLLITLTLFKVYPIFQIVDSAALLLYLRNFGNEEYAKHIDFSIPFSTILSKLKYDTLGKGSLCLWKPRIF